MAHRRWAASSMPRRSAGVSRAPASGQNARTASAPPHGLDAPGEALPAQHGQHSLSAAALFHRRVPSAQATRSRPFMTHRRWAASSMPRRSAGVSRAPASGQNARTASAPPRRAARAAQFVRSCAFSPGGVHSAQVTRSRPFMAHRRWAASSMPRRSAGVSRAPASGQNARTSSSLPRRAARAAQFVRSCAFSPAGVHHSAQATRSSPFMAHRRWAASSMPRRSAGVSRAPASGQNARTASARPRRTASMRPAKRSPRSTGST